MQPPVPCRCGGSAAALLLLGLLLLAAGPRLATANDGESPSPSPNESTGTTDTADVDLRSPFPTVDGVPAPTRALGGTLPASNNGSSSIDAAPIDNREGKPLLTPSVTEMEGRTIYYEVPEDPKGLLVFFHGCTHNAYDFWPEQQDCPECCGLPEEVSHTKQALSAGYAFAAMHSLNRDEDGKDIKCFSWEDDRETAVEALRKLPEELGLEDLPIYVSGVSSGASFALRLPSEMPGELSGVISEVLAVPKTDQTEYDWGNWPPVAFISMPKDTTTEQRIAENQEVLQAAGVPAQVLNVYERAVYPTFFSDQTIEISPALSQKTTAALKEIGMLDADGRLLEDPRHGFKHLNWRSQLTEMVPELDGTDPSNSVLADASDISELLNVAYAGHEIVGDYTFAILKWLEGSGDADLEQLGAEYAIRKPALLSPERLGKDDKPATAGDPPLPYAKM